jgi:hypothetical protein
MAEEIRVFGEFTRDACTSCPERDKCAGFLVANIIHDGARESSRKSARRAKTLFSRAINEVINSFDEAGRQESIGLNKNAYNLFNGLHQFSETVERVTTAVITHAVESQAETDAEERLRCMEEALGSVVSRRYNLPITIDRNILDEAGRDVWLYATSGKCGALKVDDSRRREF